VTTTRRSISLAALLIPPAALVGSLVVLAVGIVMAVSESDALVAALNSPDATAADVYGGQARLAIGSSLLGAGIVGVVLSLATVAIVATIRAFTPRHPEARPELAADLEPEAGSHDEEWVDVDAPEAEESTDPATADEARRMDVAASGR
jgi:hypothetical protein